MAQEQDDDPCILERLHNELAKAIAESEDILAERCGKWLDDELLERYSVAQNKALAIGRQIAAYRTKQGVDREATS